MAQDYITAPLTAADIASTADEDGVVTATVLADFSRLLEQDYEQNLDYLSGLLIGSDLLMDIAFTLVGAVGGDALVTVTGVVPDLD